MATNTSIFSSPTHINLQTSISDPLSWNDTTFVPDIFPLYGSEYYYKPDEALARLIVRIDHRGNLIFGRIDGNSTSGYFPTNRRIAYRTYGAHLNTLSVTQGTSHSDVLHAGFSALSNLGRLRISTIRVRDTIALPDSLNKENRLKGHFDTLNYGMSNPGEVKGFFYLHAYDSTGQPRLLYTGIAHPLPIFISSIIKHKGRIYCAGSIARMTYCSDSTSLYQTCRAEVKVPFGRDTLRFQTIAAPEGQIAEQIADSSIRNQTDAWIGVFDLDGNPLWCVQGKTPYFSNRIIHLAVQEDGDLLAAASLVPCTCFGSTCIDTFPQKSVEDIQGDGNIIVVNFTQRLVGLLIDSTGVLKSSDNIGPAGGAGTLLDPEGLTLNRSFSYSTTDADGNPYVALNFSGRFYLDTTLLFSGQAYAFASQHFQQRGNSSYFASMIVKIDSAGRYKGIVPIYNQVPSTGQIPSMRRLAQVRSFVKVKDQFMVNLLLDSGGDGSHQVILMIDSSGQVVDTVAYFKLYGDAQEEYGIYLFRFNQALGMDSCGHVYVSAAFNDYLILDDDTIAEGDKREFIGMRDTIFTYIARLRKRGALWVDTLSTRVAPPVQTKMTEASACG